MTSLILTFQRCFKMKDPNSSAPPRSMDSAEYGRRLRVLVAALRRRGLDGAVITEDVSRLYYTGFASTAGTLLVDVAEGPVFVVDFRYILMARKAMPFAKCVLQKSGDPSQVARHVRGWRKAGYEARQSVSAYEELRKRLDKVEVWEAVDDAIASQRAVKSAAEQKALRRAIAANDHLYARVLGQLSPGMTEWDVRGLFRRGADEVGQGEAFATIVCAGANGAECHHEPDLTPIPARGPVLMDFGVILDHYCSDMTRCVCFGRPTALYRKIHGIVLEANRRAIAKLRPGMTGEEVDAIARRHIAKAGYGDAFGHSLGHSVGMEIHEGPNFSPRESRVIKPGMVVTVEPGIYLPGRLGVRIEDVVLVTRTGCECLSRSPRDLVVL